MNIISLTQESIRHGEIKLAEGDKHKNAQDLFRHPNRVCGPTGEHAIDLLLTEMGVPHVLDGGVNSNPDLLFGETRVAVKTRGMRLPVTADDWFFCPEQQIHHSTKRHDWFLFLGMSLSRGGWMPVGAIHPLTFLEFAVPFRAGDSNHWSRYPTVNDCRAVQAESLIPFDQWIKEFA